MPERALDKTADEKTADMDGLRYSPDDPYYRLGLVHTDMDGLRYSPDDPYYRLGLVHTCLYVRVRETGDWDLFLGPLQWARAETGGADRGF